MSPDTTRSTAFFPLKRPTERERKKRIFALQFMYMLYRKLRICFYHKYLWIGFVIDRCEDFFTWKNDSQRHDFVGCNVMWSSFKPAAACIYSSVMCVRVCIVSISSRYCFVMITLRYYYLVFSVHIYKSKYLLLIF